MCGICGIAYTDSQRPVDPNLLQRMTDVITHRGPDDEGHYIENGVGLGSRRLSIVGLDSGHMPMTSPDGSLVLVYNGELYNHPSLRRALESKGYQYRTNADTETFLHLYNEYGYDFLKQTRGMFALALWDCNQRVLILARDRLGIKPLYYHFDNHGIRFASEVKSILCDPEVPRRMNYDALNFFLMFLSAPAPYTMFQGIRQVQPGEMVVFDGEKLVKEEFWSAADRITPDEIFDLETMKSKLLDKMRKTVKDHLMADVPVGAFLSGGIDSSILAVLMHEQLGGGFQTFSIGFEGNKLFDEAPQARQMAQRLGTDHHEKILRPQDLLKSLDDITWQLDEPLADSSCLPVYYVSQLAAQHVKVVLSGDGGDEIFAGYRKYQAEFYRKFFQWIPESGLSFLSDKIVERIPESRANRLMDFLRQVKKFFRGLDPNPFQRHMRWAVHYEDPLREDLLDPDVKSKMIFDLPSRYRRKFFEEVPVLDELSRMLWVDLRHGLPADMLMKVDRMSMLHSLEVRVPFLDHLLVEYAFSLPDAVKLNQFSTKWILKESFKDLLPLEVIKRPKHGFDVPVGEWFRSELRDVIEDVCSDETTKRRGLFNPRRLRQVLKDHQDGRRELNNQLWILLSLELWQRRYLDLPPGNVPERPTSMGSL